MKHVREQKRRRKRKKPGQTTRTPSPEADPNIASGQTVSSVQNNDEPQTTADTEEDELKANGLYRAHVVEVPKIGQGGYGANCDIECPVNQMFLFSYEESLSKKIHDGDDQPAPIRPREKVFNQADQRNFMLNLGQFQVVYTVRYKND
jgi:hypothetical protein